MTHKNQSFVRKIMDWLFPYANGGILEYPPNHPRFHDEKYPENNTRPEDLRRAVTVAQSLMERYRQETQVYFVASALNQLADITKAEAVSILSDLPEKLPCDVSIGAGIFRAGVDTRIVLEKIKWWQERAEEGITPIRAAGGIHRLTVHVLLDTLAAAAKGEKLDPEICQTIENIASEYKHKDFTPDDVLALYECGWPKKQVKESTENVTCENASNTDDSSAAGDRQAALDAVDWIENLLQGIVDTEGEHNEKCRLIRIGLRYIIPATLTAPTVDVDTDYDDASVDYLAAAMKQKLDDKREEGRSGWQFPDQCSADDLSRMLREHVEKGDPVDVANFCMMLFNRGDRITKQISSPHEYDCACTVKERYSGHRIDCDVPQRKGDA